MTPTSAEPVRLALPVSADDHIRGRVDAPVSVVEYGDFECPYCAQARVTLERVQSELRDHMMLVFRHFPLSEIHPHAELASEAVESVAAQGKFWAMHDTVFANQADLSVPALLRYAERVGADAGRVESDLAARVWKSRVKRDVNSGQRSGVEGTPTFFIDGFLYEGSWDYPSLLRVLSMLASDS